MAQLDVHDGGGLSVNKRFHVHFGQSSDLPKGPYAAREMHFAGKNGWNRGMLPWELTKIPIGMWECFHRESWSPGNQGIIIPFGKWYFWEIGGGMVPLGSLYVWIPMGFRESNIFYTLYPVLYL